MVRNDYRRALILLRSNAAAYSGHVRLERRTLMGSMYFMLRTPEDAGTLEAVLVGRGKDSYHACPIGTLRKDARGQMTLGWSFNPRDVCGRELEQYQKIIVARREGEDCSIVLFGNLNGFAEMNWERVRSAVCLSLQTGPARGTDTPPEPEEQEAPTEEPIMVEIPEADAAEIIIEETPALPEAGMPAEAAQAEGQVSAAEAAGLDTDLPWPAEIEGLRTLFRTQPALANAPDADHTYVLAPMPEGSGYAACAIGLRGENGVPTAVCYAIRAHYTTQPPAGLEDYTWQGNANEGWWALETAVIT